MDLEQLKLILDTIQSMGGDAKEFGMWWLACSLIRPLLLFAFGVGAVTAARAVLLSMVRSANVSHEVARKVGCPVLGMWSRSDTRNVLDRIDGLMAHRYRVYDEKADGQ